MAVLPKNAAPETLPDAGNQGRAVTGGVARSQARGRISSSLRSHCSAWPTIVSRSSYCGAQGSVALMRALSAMSDGGSPARRPSMRRSTVQVGHPVDRVEHFEHREAAAVAAVHRQRPLRLGDQRLEREHVGGGEIADVDVIAHPGAVGGVVIGAEHADVARLPSAASTATLIRCVAPAVDWPLRPRGSAPATLKYLSAQ